MGYSLYMVDVFAERAFAGNPLAVVMDADGLDGEVMQQIAAEMNFSETTFVMSEPEGDAGYRVRIFTPAREIAFAGHPILGTAWVLRRHLGIESCGQVLLNLPASQVVARFEAPAGESEIVWFEAPSMSLGKTVPTDQLAAAVGLSTGDIETQTPIQVVSAGTAAMIVPLRSLDALRRSQLDLGAFEPLAAQGFPPLVYLYSRETHHPRNDLCARFFFEAHGVREDPATGNGAAFLGAYLLAHRVYEAPALSLRIEQGHEVRRPSLVMLRAQMSDTGPRVSIGGHVVATVRGELLTDNL
ncbi:MAG: PhzF family phenazine biosynthesis protein [Gammaproteobacteria bacterium]|nr:PhzF family phenazine biosynthesis protein [Gammaproteobacteria bacterium]MCP5317964.1 PhzF family phenazine biosynthesis protein [Chromatiaceae bacterium]MCB1817592.1 PhzF family phenazine biosynthesis protein [Gammaproteobacteria bacterium]MCP5435437.1 PhzF family phenazine biosynthesis protein [Chromatiaceae bacterium]HOP16499.1 PhzF family phenazine biosynthesis protein [Gammaproteobacteria bacterium]